MNKHFFHLFVSILLINGLMLLSNCKKEESLPEISSLTLSHQSIYELLPASTNVSELSTNLGADNIRFLLVAGEGDTNNSDFEIKGNLLRTKKSLDIANGSSRSIRIRVTDGTSEYETTASIDLIKFEGTYPSLTSPSFTHNEQMPRAFGADNGNVSPDLTIMDVPANTVSMVIMMQDLDDGNSFHWTVWNIPPDKTRIVQNENWIDGAILGDNSFGEGYTGPFPPSEHRYKTSVIFLSDTITLDPSDYFSLIPSLTGKMIAQVSIVGKYKP